TFLYTIIYYCCTSFTEIGICLSFFDISKPFFCLFKYILLKIWHTYFFHNLMQNNWNNQFLCLGSYVQNLHLLCKIILTMLSNFFYYSFCKISFFLVFICYNSQAN